jgi:hypothetical protein
MNSARLRQRLSIVYASATLAGSRVFHASSAIRAFCVALSAEKGGSGGRSILRLLTTKRRQSGMASLRRRAMPTRNIVSAFCMTTERVWRRTTPRRRSGSGSQQTRDTPKHKTISALYTLGAGRAAGLYPGLYVVRLIGGAGQSAGSKE